MSPSSWRRSTMMEMQWSPTSKCSKHLLTIWIWLTKKQTGIMKTSTPILSSVNWEIKVSLRLENFFGTRRLMNGEEMTKTKSLPLSILRKNRDIRNGWNTQDTSHLNFNKNFKNWISSPNLKKWWAMISHKILSIHWMCKHKNQVELKMTTTSQQSDWAVESPVVQNQT